MIKEFSAGCGLFSQDPPEATPEAQLEVGKEKL